jgi:hypothetical protein
MDHGHSATQSVLQRANFSENITTPVWSRGTPKTSSSASISLVFLLLTCSLSLLSLCMHNITQ